LKDSQDFAQFIQASTQRFKLLAAWVEFLDRYSSEALQAVMQSFKAAVIFACAYCPPFLLQYARAFSHSATQTLQLPLAISGVV